MGGLTCDHQQILYKFLEQDPPAQFVAFENMFLSTTVHYRDTYIHCFLSKIRGMTHW